METEVNYEKVGRFIYGFIRVRGSFDFFCQSLEQGGDPITPDMPVRQFLGRTKDLLTLRYGANSVIAREFSETAAITGDERMNDIKAGFDTTKVPSDAETSSVLSVQARLDHLRQLMDAA